MSAPDRSATALAADAPHMVRFRWPDDDGPEAAASAGNFFFGYWRADHHIAATLELPSSIAHTTRIGERWLLASAVSPLHEPPRGLVHHDAKRGLALGFRGHLAEAVLHSYSSAEELLGYWSTRSHDEHNGCFAAALLDDRARAIALYTDALGLAPLYWRQLEKGIAFSTHARVLAFDGDSPDMLAWRSLLQCGFVLGDRSLTQGVQRVPPGHCVEADTRGVRVRRWFDFATLPRGGRRAGPDAVSEVEVTFRRATDRALRVAGLDVMLPLSSGHDSRRFLAHFLDQRVQFNAITARVFQKGHRDLDATYAAEMARDFGFPHSVVEPATVDRYVDDDAQRRALVDAETPMHTWALRLFAAFPHRPCAVFDGVLGDILGNPGFRLPTLYRSPEEDIEIIAQTLVVGDFDRVPRRDRWPGADALRDEVRKMVAPWMPRANIAEFGFILGRQRRMTALWSHQLLPPGHVAICPYADLEYLRLLLDFVPMDKHAIVFQRACLERFWPAYAKYAGNRDIPAGIPSRSAKDEHAKTLACMRRLTANDDVADRAADLLAPFARLRFRAGLASEAIALRYAWYVQPLLELVDRDLRRRACWSVQSRDHHRRDRANAFWASPSSPDTSTSGP